MTLKIYFENYKTENEFYSLLYSPVSLLIISYLDDNYQTLY